MRFSWQISTADTLRVQELVRSQSGSDMVKERRAKYRQRRLQPVTKATFWKANIMGLVTSQQPSSPGTYVARFLRQRPFALTYQRCSEQRNLGDYAEREIREAGLRFSNRLAGMLSRNFRRMNDGLWSETSEALETLRKARWRGKARLKRIERETAAFVDKRYVGFGPKQARNVLQHLGLTKYEIPLDSRVMKWLNDFGFPIRLSAQGLADRNYYTFVLDAVQELCEKSRVDPYILDAAIFNSFDSRSSGLGEAGSVPARRSTN